MTNSNKYFKNDLKEENAKLYNYINLLEDRLQHIADYVGANNYIDSIGPILEAIDQLKIDCEYIYCEKHEKMIPCSDCRKVNL